VAGDVTVGAVGTLLGQGGIGGNLFNIAGGLVLPGGRTIGTLTVAANYRQGAASGLGIEVSPVAAGKLLIGGAAQLGGTLTVIYDPGTYTKGSFDIVHAASVSGTFSTLTGTAPLGFAQSLAYTPTDVDLLVNPVIIAPTTDTVFNALGTAALLGAQQANATLLGHLSGLHSGSGSEMIRTAWATPRRRSSPSRVRPISTVRLRPCPMH
jgi:hypothetical protein